MPRQQATSMAAERDLANAIKDSKSPAIARAAAILRMLGKSDTPIALQAISRELGIVPSTCLYTLRALVEEQLVAFDPTTKRYSLEAGILTLARQWLRGNRFTDLAQPLLENLSEGFGVTTMGVNVVGLEHMIVVSVAQASGNFQLSAQIGSRFPALISATGRCVAAFGQFNEEELADRFQSLRWDNPPDYQLWLEEVEDVKRRGFAVDEGHYISGVNVVAAPVWGAPGKLGHAIAALGIGSALHGGRLEELTRELVLAAETLSHQLCGDIS